MSFQHESSLNMNTLDERLLTVMDVLHTPVWVYDIQRHRTPLFTGPNDAALGLWEASSPSIPELKSRDFSADMAAAIDLLLQRYLGDFQQERSYNEWWTLSPKGSKTGLSASFRDPACRTVDDDGGSGHRCRHPLSGVLPRHFSDTPRPVSLTTRGASRRQPSLRHVLWHRHSDAAPDLLRCGRAFYRRLSRLDES